MNSSIKAAIFCNFGSDSHDLNRVFAPRLKARLQARTRLFPHIITDANFAQFTAQLHDVEVIFATWGMWELSPQQLATMPNLKAVFYAAGSVQQFARPLLERGILLTSAWMANAVPVAEFTMAQILLANKGYFANLAAYRECGTHGAIRGQGNFGATVSILGAGQIGRRVVELLQPFRLRVLVFDPYLSQKGADLLGVEKIESLAQAFECSNVVSNHIADLPATQNMIRGAHFDLMPQSATFINTGRGRTVKHDELLSVFERRADLTALLDVTEPEPLPLSHPLWQLPNVHLSSHIAGSIGDEVERMGEAALDEFDAWQAGKPMQGAVSLEMLATMA